MSSYATQLRTDDKTGVQIQSVTVINTGSGEAHPEHIFGTRKPALWWIFTSKQWVEIPVYVYVIQHAQGLVLFDTGIDLAVMSNPHYFPDKVTDFFYAPYLSFSTGSEG